MYSVVISIQKDLVDSTKNVSDILRQAFILSRKLKIVDFENWIHQELNGYSRNDNIPEYRHVQSTIKGWNPYNGWLPVIIQDPKVQEEITNSIIAQSIPELEDLLNNSKGGLHAQLPDSFGEFTGHYTRYIAEIGKSSVKGIIEKVKNIIMEWILKLEEDGILGENMSFTDEEKKIADQKNYTVNNFYGNISGSQIQQNSDHSSQEITNETLNTELLNEILTLLIDNKSRFSEEIENSGVLTREIEKINTESKKSKPSKVILVESLKTIRSLLEGIAGNIIAAGLLYKIGLFI